MNPKRVYLILFALAAGCRTTTAQAAGQASKPDSSNRHAAVRVEYIAHACFRVTSPSGKQILLDPYASRVWLGYDFPPNPQALATREACEVTEEF